jgi:hypothetical protein
LRERSVCAHGRLDDGVGRGDAGRMEALASASLGSAGSSHLP